MAQQTLEKGWKELERRKERQRLQEERRGQQEHEGARVSNPQSGVSSVPSALAGSFKRAMSLRSTPSAGKSRPGGGGEGGGGQAHGQASGRDRGTMRRTHEEAVTLALCDFIESRGGTLPLSKLQQFYDSSDCPSDASKVIAGLGGVRSVCSRNREALALRNDSIVLVTATPRPPSGPRSGGQPEAGKVRAPPEMWSTASIAASSPPPKRAPPPTPPSRAGGGR